MELIGMNIARPWENRHITFETVGRFIHFRKQANRYVMGETRELISKSLITPCPLAQSQTVLMISTGVLIPDSGTLQFPSGELNRPSLILSARVREHRRYYSTSRPVIRLSFNITRKQSCPRTIRWPTTEPSQRGQNSGMFATRCQIMTQIIESVLQKP